MTKFHNEFRVESIRLKDWDYTTPWWYFVTINIKGHKKYFGSIINGKIILNDFGKVVQREWLKSKQIRKNIDLDYFVVMPDHIHGIIILNESNNLNHADCRDVRQNVSQTVHQKTSQTVHQKTSQTDRLNISKTFRHPPVTNTNIQENTVNTGDVHQNVSQTVHQKTSQTDRLNISNTGDVHQNVSTNEQTQKNANNTENKNEFFSKISPKSNSLSVIIRGFKASVTKYAHENGIFEFQWQSRFYDRIIRNEVELYNIRRYIEQNPLSWEMDM